MTSDGKASRKEKQKNQRKKNRKIWERFLMTADALQQVNRDGGLAAPEFKPDKPQDKPRRDLRQQQQTQSRLDEIRSRTTQRRMRAQERWNRFSGTEDAGARGL